jgi:hypothetical protein
MDEKRKPMAIACGVLKKELDTLASKGVIDFPIHFLNSNLHMHPQRLRQRMAGLLERERRADMRILLIYGDCHPFMEDWTAARDVVRVRAVNCAEMLLGKQGYKTLVKKGAFLLLPEWTGRWRQVLEAFPGLDRDSAAELVHGQHTNLVYLDTGIIPVPYVQLAACSEFLGLPFTIEGVSLEHLTSLIMEAMESDD